VSKNERITNLEARVNFLIVEVQRLSNEVNALRIRMAAIPPNVTYGPMNPYQVTCNAGKTEENLLNGVGWAEKTA
jgi:hypothetical protein